jgi:hypothetical protein
MPDYLIPWEADSRYAAQKDIHNFFLKYVGMKEDIGRCWIEVEMK